MYCKATFKPSIRYICLTYKTPLIVESEIKFEKRKVILRVKYHEYHIIKENIAGRIPETTRRRKLPIHMTKQQKQLLWTLNFHKCHKKFKEE